MPDGGGRGYLLLACFFSMYSTASFYRRHLFRRPRPATSMPNASFSNAMTSFHLIERIRPPQVRRQTTPSASLSAFVHAKAARR